jgi:hypothetical protein
MHALALLYKSFSLQFLTTLLIGLQKSFFEEMKIYEKPLIAQLMIKDDYQEDRAKKVISNLSEFLKQSLPIAMPKNSTSMPFVD